MVEGSFPVVEEVLAAAADHLQSVVMVYGTDWDRPYQVEEEEHNWVAEEPFQAVEPFREEAEAEEPSQAEDAYLEDLCWEEYCCWTSAANNQVVLLAACCFYGSDCEDGYHLPILVLGHRNCTPNRFRNFYLRSIDCFVFFKTLESLRSRLAFTREESPRTPTPSHMFYAWRFSVLLRVVVQSYRKRGASTRTTTGAKAAFKKTRRRKTAMQ